MYEKVFSTMFTGSMMGSGGSVFAVMTYAIVNVMDEDGHVELNPRLLASLIGESIPTIEQAIEFLTQSDPNSRTPDEQGRRLVKEGQFLYRLVNYPKFDKMRKAEEKREYWRDWKRRKRAENAECPTMSKHVHLSPQCPHPSPSPSPSVKKESKQRKKSRRFAPPSPSEVNQYAKSIGFVLDGQGFCDFYASKGWKVGSSPMKDWKAAVRTWKKRELGPKPPPDKKCCQCGGPADAVGTDVTGQEYGWCRKCQPVRWAKFLEQFPNASR